MEHYFTNNTNLKSEMRVINFENNGHVFTFCSDLGVFSKDHIDYGSKVLVQTILDCEKRDHLQILDVGCGYGFIGIVLAKELASKVTMIDINKRAIHLCIKNIKTNEIDGQCLESDCYQNVTGTYDLIVTNPPIRAGKTVVLEILENAQKYLQKNGHLWFVIRKDQGAKSIIKSLETTYQVDIIKKEKGFFVMCAKKIDTT